MSEEEKAALEAEQAEETAEESEAIDEQTTEGKAEAEPDEESKQLAAELERERLAREKAEKALAEDRYKRAESKRKEKEEVYEEPEEKPLTRKDLESLLAKEREATKKELTNKEAERLAEQLSGSDLEKQLTLEKWKTLSFPEHISLEEQIESCYAVANRKRLIGQHQEALRALKGKEGVSKDTSSTHHEAPLGGQPKLPSNDAAELARVGFKFNASAKRFEKKLPNGKLMIKKDLKSTTQIVEA